MISVFSKTLLHYFRGEGRDEDKRKGRKGGESEPSHFSKRSDAPENNLLIYFVTERAALHDVRVDEEALLSERVLETILTLNTCFGPILYTNLYIKNIVLGKSCSWF